MIGIELNSEGHNIVSDCLYEGLLINCTMGNTLRFLPPLIITKQEVDTCINTLDAVLAKQG